MYFEIEELANLLSEWGLQSQTVVASGGFDPLHIGHVRYLEGAAAYGPLVVIVNKDEFLIRKKGVPFMPEEERVGIIEALRCVSFVTTWHQQDCSVSGALEILKPKYFAKGGDRTLDNIPERQTCLDLDIEMVFNVGGGKIQSSSWLTRK